MRPLVQHVVTGVVGFLIVVVYGLTTAVSPGVTAWGQRVLVSINNGHSAALDGFARAFSVGFSPPYAFTIVVVLVVVIALVGRRVGDALFVGVSIGVVYACTYVVKEIVRRPRPSILPYPIPGLPPETDPSYPSGHVAIVSSLVLILVLVAVRAWQRWVIAFVGAVLVVATAFARLYAGVHYPDDVAASVVYVGTVGPLIYACLGWLEARWSLVDHTNQWMAKHWKYFAVERSPDL